MDRLGLSFVQAAGVMNSTLPMSETLDGSVGAIAEYERVRGSIASTVVHIQVYAHCLLFLGAETNTPRSFAHALVRGPDFLTSSTDHAPPLNSFLSDTTVHWIDYPNSRQPKPIRSDRLIQERWSLTLFMSQAIQLFPRVQKNFARRDFFKTVERLADRMESWMRTLPSDFNFAADMPPPLYELQYVTNHTPSRDYKMTVIQYPVV